MTSSVATDTRQGNGTFVRNCPSRPHSPESAHSWIEAQFSLAGDDDTVDAETMEVVLDAGLSVAVVRGDRPGWLAS